MGLKSSVLRKDMRKDVKDELGDSCQAYDDKSKLRHGCLPWDAYFPSILKLFLHIATVSQ